MGIRPRREHRRQGVLHLAEPQRARARRPVHRLRRRLEGPVELLGHTFADARLLERALTHRSYGADHNERLEFLGDGVLGCAVADELYTRFPSLPEGKLTRLRASLVREEALAEAARRMGL